MRHLFGVYRELREAPSDISEHMDLLRSLACGCDQVVELGVRQGVSTIALLAGMPRSLHSVDVMEHPKAHYKGVQIPEGVSFSFAIGNSLEDASVPECDFLFIDTLHTRAQLAKELELHAPKASRWIAMHDTETFGGVGEDGGPGLRPALAEFLGGNPRWRKVIDVPWGHGMVILQRF